MESVTTLNPKDEGLHAWILKNRHGRMVCGLKRSKVGLLLLERRRTSVVDRSALTLSRSKLDPFCVFNRYVRKEDDNNKDKEKRKR